MCPTLIATINPFARKLYHEKTHFYQSLCDENAKIGFSKEKKYRNKKYFKVYPFITPTHRTSMTSFSRNPCDLKTNIHTTEGPFYKHVGDSTQGGRFYLESGRFDHEHNPVFCIKSSLRNTFVVAMSVLHHFGLKTAFG